MWLLEIIYFDVVTREIPTKFHLSTRDSTLWQNKVKHAQDYILFVPINGINQFIWPRKFIYILSYHLGTPLFEVDIFYPNCNRVIDVFSDHALHWKVMWVLNSTKTWRLYCIYVFQSRVGYQKISIVGVFVRHRQCSETVQYSCL